MNPTPGIRHGTEAPQSRNGDGGPLTDMKDSESHP